MTGAKKSRAGRITTVSVVALILLVGAYVGGRQNNAESEDGSSAQETAAAGQIDRSGSGVLEIRLSQDAVYCDSTDREVGEIQGAEPGERILFSSPVPIDSPEGVADESGRYRLFWNCDPNESRLQWDMVAIGHDSGRRVSFTVVGSDTDPAAPDGLRIEVIDTPFTCDGFTRPIGSLSGAAPNEQIVFTSRETSNLRPGKADQNGELELNWKCEPADAGTTWTVTATAPGSGRAGLFTISGVPVDPAAIAELAVEMLEDPFVCDGRRREFATIDNFAPLEVVDFSSPDAENLIDGRADGQGRITLRWQCGLQDSSKIWRLTALGVTSQRTATVTITAAAPDPGTMPEPSVAYTENPFRCDGGSRPFAVISNFVPGEYVDFSSPQSGPLRQGQAGDDGDLPVRWQCGTDDTGKSWDLTATGATSGRSITFTVTGSQP